MSKIKYQQAVLLIFLGCFIFMEGCKTQTKKGYTVQEKKQFEENLIMANRGLVAKDQEVIADFIAKKEWKMQKTETGLWYELIKTNKGKKAESGMVAQLTYEVRLLNGTLCYTSDSLGIKTFKIGQGGVESGLEEAVLLLSEGDSARFIMPPHLAWGLLGDENKIPSRSIIVYNVELLKLTD